MRLMAEVGHLSLPRRAHAAAEQGCDMYKRWQAVIENDSGIHPKNTTGMHK